MKPTIFWLPNEAETLLEDTRKATILDLRVAKIFAMTAPPHKKPQDEESDVEYCIRAWGHLLPDVGGEGRSFRVRYGWTNGEFEDIGNMLLRAQVELLKMSREATIGKVSLIRDAEVCVRLHEEWSYPHMYSAKITW